MSSLSLQCLSSPSKRDSLDEGYDPDETLKIIVSDDGKKVDILRDSDEEEDFPEELVEYGHDDDADVVIQQQRPVDFDRWDFMKDPAVLAKDTADIVGRIALGDSPLALSPEPKEVRFVDMDTTGSQDNPRAGPSGEMSQYRAEQEYEELIQHTDNGRRRSSQISSGAAISDQTRDQSIIQQMSTEDLKRHIKRQGSTSLDSDEAVYFELMKRIKSQSSGDSLSKQISTEDLKSRIEKLASSSVDSDQAVYLELMKKLQSQSDSELDSDTVVYKELVERQLAHPQRSEHEQKKSSRMRHASMSQQSQGLQRMGHVNGSSIESNGYLGETGIPGETGEEEDVSGTRYYRHGDQN